MMRNGMFHGSYLPEDVTFLLKKVNLLPLDLEERENRIQSGLSHYSMMIGAEHKPDPEYLEIFHTIFQQNLKILVSDFINLASQINEKIYRGPITLASIARSGIPIGVVLTRILRLYFLREVNHYSISVIRDIGVDFNAMKFMIERHPLKSIMFIDGWIGKGTISKALYNSLEIFERTTNLKLNKKISVITDLAGLAYLSAGESDYLIPTAILNSIVSGLISRTIYREDLISSTDFHGCNCYPELKSYDLSLFVVDKIMEAVQMSNLLSPVKDFCPQYMLVETQQKLRKISQNFLEGLQRRYSINDTNLIKPGLGEAIRVLLRRVPELLLLKDSKHPDVLPLVHLARQKNTRIIEENGLPYLAVAIIQDRSV